MVLHAFGAYDLINLGVWHPLDYARVVRKLQNLYAIGERPSYEEVKRYLEELWPSWPVARRRARTIWRKILDNPATASGSGKGRRLAGTSLD